MLLTILFENDLLRPWDSQKENNPNNVVASVVELIASKLHYLLRNLMDHFLARTALILRLESIAVAKFLTWKFNN